MRRPLRHKAKKNFRHVISLLLCLILAVSCYSAPVLGAEFSEQPTDETELINEAAQQTENESAEISEEPELQAEGTTESDTEEKPDPVTVTFNMGGFGVRKYVVSKGGYLVEAPDIPYLQGAYVLGWYNEYGVNVSPLSIPVEEDTVYTARWSRNVSDILNTDAHSAYIGGYDNGMFKPNHSVTRAEAAKMLYSLLRNTYWEKKYFSDIYDKWYTEAVSTMAGLGVIRGYDDGTFKANKEITRAEFVSMVVNCDTILDGPVMFSDVSNNHWAASYIATATAKGWINGFPDGSFRPDEKITRAQAVTVINNMLGRSPDEHIKEKKNLKNFYDVFDTHWAYGEIAEASTAHSYSKDSYGETWYVHDEDTSAPESDHWVIDGNEKYYVDAATGKFLRGEHTIDGEKYLFDSSTGAAFTGFKKIGAWNRYYKNGLMMDDISDLGLVSGPYFIKVYKNSNYLIIFAKDQAGNYNIPVKAMRVSCGNPTPVGTFYTPYRYRWLKMVGDTWAQWCTQIQGNYLFHSVPNWTQNNADLEVDEFNHLGDTRSLGCIRLNCRDAKWIYDNCELETKVTITVSENSGPLSKPDGIQIPGWHTWDPTDPTAYWRCQQKGCH